MKESCIEWLAIFSFSPCSIFHPSSTHHNCPLLLSSDLTYLLSVLFTPMLKTTLTYLFFSPRNSFSVTYLLQATLNWLQTHQFPPLTPLTGETSCSSLHEAPQSHLALLLLPLQHLTLHRHMLLTTGSLWSFCSFVCLLVNISSHLQSYKETHNFDGNCYECITGRRQIQSRLYCVLGKTGVALILPGKGQAKSAKRKTWPSSPIFN